MEVLSRPLPFLRIGWQMITAGKKSFPLWGYSTWYISHTPVESPQIMHIWFTELSTWKKKRNEVGKRIGCWRNMEVVGGESGGIWSNFIVYMYKIIKDIKNIFTIRVSPPHTEYLLKGILHTLLNSPKGKDEKIQCLMSSLVLKIVVFIKLVVFYPSPE